MKIKIHELESRLGKKIKRNFSVIGWDTSSKCGVCFGKSNDKEVEFDWTFLEYDTSDHQKMYKQMYDDFGSLLSDENLSIIEQVFVSFNPNVALLLARMGSLIMARCIEKKIPFQFLSAVSARGNLGIKTRLDKNGNKIPKGHTKEVVANWLKEELNFEIDQNDIADALVLVLNGLCEDTVYTKKAKKKKKRVK
jgi:Holliday junction resolvasome RuvABC endonuclease subunit